MKKLIDTLGVLPHPRVRELCCCDFTDPGFSVLTVLGVTLGRRRELFVASPLQSLPLVAISSSVHYSMLIGKFVNEAGFVKKGTNDGHGAGEHRGQHGLH